MTILHTATRESDFTSFNLDNAYFGSGNSTDVNFLDSNYVTHCIEGSSADNRGISAVIETVAPATTYWLHFNFRKPGSDASALEDGYILDIFDASDNLIYRWDVLDGNSIHTIYGDTTNTTFVSSNSISRYSVTAYDISVTVDASNITVEVFENGTSQGSGTVANTTSGFGKPTKVNFALNDVTYIDVFRNVGISEVIVADEPTIGMRLAELSLSSAGNYSDHTGTLAGQFDNNNETFLNSNTNGDRTSATLSAYGGSTTGYEIVDVRMTSLAKKTINANVSTLKHFARIGATDYDNATAHSVSSSSATHQSSWTTNPNTASAWAFSDLATVELGIKAET
jgi:hypothetical protein